MARSFRSRRWLVRGCCVALPGSFAMAAADPGPLAMTYDPPTPAPSAQKAAAAAAATPAAEPPASWVSPKATFLLSNEPWHDDPEILWPGFLSGLRGFEHFFEPVGNPLYFESPFINTSARLLYLAHDFPNDSQLGGGNVNVYALQLRVALSDRLAFIATKDGWSDLNARTLPNGDGWNDFAIGAKYAFWVDRENDWVMTGGMRWEWANGDREVLQGGSQELSPFISFAKGWDNWHLLGNVTGRIPTDQDAGNNILQWDLHLDCEVAPETLPGFAPMVELHGLHYLSNGDRFPLSVGGFDYTNLGSMDVDGDSVISLGVGFRWKLNPHASIGSTWAFPLTDASDDIMGNRLTLDVILSY